MTEYQIFNLEEIKELISSFNDLQSGLNLLKSLSDDFNTKEIKINDLNISIENLSTFPEILSSIQSLVDDLLPITKHNIIVFNEFQKALLSKFKRNYMEKLKRLKINKATLQKFGNSLIKNKNISKIVSNISYVHSIKFAQWVELIDSLKQNSIFKNIIRKFNEFYLSLIEAKLNEQISKIQDNLDESVLNNYKKAFYEQPNLTFSEYQNLYDTNLSKEELEAKKSLFEKEQKELDLEKLKEDQEKQDELYQDYLRLSSKEFERKRRKERRGKLSKIDLKSKNQKKVEISEETSEKIEKFKSDLDHSSKNSYLVNDDENKSPIDLIRERKKKKSEEFKRYKKHFETE
jgi:hypothetical protein